MCHAHTICHVPVVQLGIKALTEEDALFVTRIDVGGICGCVL